MDANQYQDLSRFGGTARGGAAWRAQLWWLFETLFVLPTPQYMFGWRRLALSESSSGNLLNMSYGMASSR